MEKSTKIPANITDDAFALITKCKEYAAKCHADTNHLYDGEPYLVHLDDVFFFACKYVHLMPTTSYIKILSGAYTHDTIEDTRQTWNDVKEVCGEEIANITYALTNEKGKNRKERANDKYYAGLREIPEAHFLKICDRLANVRRSKQKNSGMLNKYRSEQPEFESELSFPLFQEMFNELTELLKFN